MNKFCLNILLVLLFAVGVFSQTKSIEKAGTEIKTFANFEKYSIVYDAAKYVTKAEVSFDIIEPKTPLEKQFKKFAFVITSLFAINGIEEKSVRNTLCINTQSKKFYFASDRNLTLKLDNETINLGEADRSTEVKGSKVWENLCWEIDTDLINDFAKTSKFEYEIANLKGNLTTQNLQYFKDYAQLLKIEKQ